MEFTLSFEGSEADRHLLDFYDAATALVSFQRTLALTAHLVVNGEIITQAPALKGARILSFPAQEGSWKHRAAILLGTLTLSGAVASRDSVLGNLFTSVYDYAINEALGFHVDFNKTLGQQIEEQRSRTDLVPRELDEGKIEALIEKTENSIKDIHRPIAKSGTATTAMVGRSENGIITQRTGPVLDIETFEYINITNLSEDEFLYQGKVSSYNTNTYKGRIYIEDEGRPIPFTLAENAKTIRNIDKVVKSLSASAINRFSEEAEITFSALCYESKNGRLKGYLVTQIL